MYNNGALCERESEWLTDSVSEMYGIEKETTYYNCVSWQICIAKAHTAGIIVESKAKCENEKEKKIKSNSAQCKRTQSTTMNTGEGDTELIKFCI